MKRDLNNLLSAGMHCVVMAAALVSGCNGNTEPKVITPLAFPASSPRSRDAALSQIKVCPDGHATLKNVPISYGLPSFAPEQVKLREAALLRLEYWPGGCVVGPDSPTHRVTCTTCGLGCDGRPDSWSGYARSLSHFKRPFSPLMASFPVPATNVLVASPTFYQAFTSNRVVFESVSYQTTEPYADVSERVDAWFATQKLKPMRRSSTNQHAQSGPPRQAVGWKEMNVNADLNLSQDGRVSSISVTHSRYGELSQ